MPQTEEEKKIELETEALKAKEAEEAKKAKEHNPHARSADVTKDFLDKEWTPFKKRNSTLFAEPTPMPIPVTNPPIVTAKHEDVCPLGIFCPFPNEPHE